MHGGCREHSPVGVSGEPYYYTGDNLITKEKRRTRRLPAYIYIYIYVFSLSGKRGIPPCILLL